MPLLTYRDRPIDIEPGETVLSALLRTGVDAPNSCRAGVCQTCLHRAVDGEIPPAARQGLTDAQKALGYFLACVCLPETPLAIVPADEAARRMGVVVRSIDRLSASVVRLRLEAEARFDYRSGQFLELIAPGGLERHYSLASLPDDDPFLELHIRLLDGGRMSGLVANSLAPGDRLSVAGPRGSCVYEGAAPDQPLVLAGAGTGLAPLWGILRDALRREHRAPIRLYHGARDTEGLYLADELRALAATRANFSYIPCVLDAAAPSGGDLAAAVMERERDLNASAFFLCGGEKLIGRLKRDLYLKGANLKQIRSDVFLPAP